MAIYVTLKSKHMFVHKKCFDVEDKSFRYLLTKLQTYHYFGQTCFIITIH